MENNVATSPAAEKITARTPAFPPGPKDRGHPIVPLPAITLRPKYGVPVTLSKR